MRLHASRGPVTLTVLVGSVVLLGIAGTLQPSFTWTPLLAGILGVVGMSFANAVRERWRERRDARARIQAWSGIESGNPFVVHEALLRMRPDSISLHLLASYLGICNRLDEAIELIEGTRGFGHRSPETTKLLADLYFRRGEHAAILSARALPCASGSRFRAPS